MELQLKNIGMIKEANVKIDGLTVIAGENDTGKSTLGKVLYAMLLTIRIDVPVKETFMIQLLYRIFNYSLFEKTHDNYMKLKIDNNEYSYVYNNIHSKDSDKFLYNWEWSGSKKIAIDVPFIESPLIWNLQPMFRSLSDIESQLKMHGENNINMNYPYFMKDLYFKLVTKKDFLGNWTELFIENISKIINGELKETNDGNFKFYRNNQVFDLINVATGIKYFGILQVLLKNNRLDRNTVLVLDEPEVHLHPKWQLEMAKIIVELVKNGVKVLVNSHSPYMIEALERYAEKAEVPADFYLAEDGYIAKVEDNNSKTLAKIFHKLSAPYETFNQMDSETLKGG